MIVGAARHDRQASIGQRRGQRLGIGDDLMRVSLELRRQRFLERHGLGRDYVHQRATLQAGEDGAVELLGQRLVIGQDDARTGTTQRLVGRGGGDMGMRDGRGVRAARDQAGEMRHVGEQISAYLVGNLAEAFEIPVARIGGAAADDEL